METKRIVCLANSRKGGGSCVAGKELLPNKGVGGWIRPVSIDESLGLSACDIQYENGGEPHVLDVVDIPVLNARPVGFQSENWLIDDRHRWRKIGVVEWKDLSQMEDHSEALWVNGRKSWEGINDRVPLVDAEALSDSLRLIKVDGLRITVSKPYDPRSSHIALRGRFRYNGDEYALRITDHESEKIALDMGYGEYPVHGERFLTVSLGGAYEGFCYKLIAAVIKP